MSDPQAARPTRVALLVPGFSADEHDWCIPALLDLVRALAQQVEVFVVSLRYPHRRRRYGVYGAQVAALGAAQTRGWGRLTMAWRALATLRREHRRRPFDLLHALWAHEPGYLAVRAGRALSRPVLVSVLGGEWAHLDDIGYGGALSRTTRALVTSALRRATLVSVGSRCLADDARRECRWDPRFRRWSLGVDTRRFAPRPATHDARRAAAQAAGAPLLDGLPGLLQVASLLPVKDQPLLLRAFAALVPRHPAARLHLVGTGPQEPALRALAARLALTERVRFHGAVAHERLPYVYAQADLFVLSSRFESQCLAAQEALACGVPLAGTAVGLLPELTPHLASPGDEPGLAAAIEAALGAPTGALSVLPAPLTLDGALQGLLDLYSELKSKHGA